MIDLVWGGKISLLCTWGAVFFVMWFIYVRVTHAPPSYEWFILAIKVFRMDCVYKEDASQPFEHGHIGREYFVASLRGQ